MEVAAALRKPKRAMRRLKQGLTRMNIGQPRCVRAFFA